MSRAGLRVAVVGAGLAGAACARLLADAGAQVRLFDKSRGVGGRLSTRRATWHDAGGHAQAARFDHGAPCFSAQAPDFAHAVAQAARDGLLARWTPRLAPGSYAPLDQPARWVATPDMPAWCRALTAGLSVQTGAAIDALRQGPGGWQLHSGEAAVDQGFDAVIVAIPPPQAAVLLRPHQAEWARRAAALPMLPCWALMAVTDEPDRAPDWELAWPTSGPLAWVIRDDAKPGRARVPGLAHWVVHATAAWSQTHLESPAADVQANLQAALTQQLGQPLTWRHAAVHRWRHASAPRAGDAATAALCWWDSASGLGVCCDALGGSGVEGAWRSAQALAAHITRQGPGSQAPRPSAFRPLAQP